MKYRLFSPVGCAILALLAQPVAAQERSPDATTGRVGQSTRSRAAAADPLRREERKEDLNAWTVGIAGGLLEGTFIRYAADLAKVLDDGDKLRVIPMVTFGAVGNVTDLLNLRGVDIAITQADVLDHLRREAKIPNIEKRIQYISPLFLAEVHIYTREEFKTLKDLGGRKVAFNTPGSAANLTGQVVFQRLGVSVDPVFVNNAIALERMRTGEISAVVHVVGKPNDLFARFKPEPGFHFIPVEYDSKFEDYYVPATLGAEDYPGLIPAGETVPTIAVPAVLAVFNWPKSSDRYRRVARFIEGYFAKFEQLQKAPFQPKWREINLAGKVPGWTRYAVAEEILSKLIVGENSRSAQPRAQFETFLNSGAAANRPSLSSREREALFKEFLRWQQR